MRLEHPWILVLTGGPEVNPSPYHLDMEGGLHLCDYEL